MLAWILRLLPSETPARFIGVLLLLCSCRVSGPRPDGSCESQATEKRFLNLTLPDCSEFTPIVIDASDREVIVARVAYVAGLRDIQILRQSAGTWSFFGDRGRALTGTDGSFLMDAIKGPDGRVWVLAGYTEPSNPERGDRDYLYCFEGGRWQLAGPQNGSHLGDQADRGLHFLGDGRPIRHCIDSDRARTGVTQHYLVQLQGDRWVELPAQQLLRQVDGMIAWRSRDAWLVAVERIKGSTLLRGYHLKGPGMHDIDGPYTLLPVPKASRLMFVAASEQDEIAFLIQPGRWKALDGEIMKLENGCARKVSSLTAPPRPWRVDALAWSPTGDLLSLSTDSAWKSLTVHGLQNGKWRNVAQAEQRTVGQIFDPRLYVRPDGTPIVTWEDFRPM